MASLFMMIRAISGDTIDEVPRRNSNRHNSCRPSQRAPMLQPLLFVGMLCTLHLPNELLVRLQPGTKVCPTLHTFVHACVQW